MTAMTKILATSGYLCLLATSVGADSHLGDPEAGEKVFKKCKACHQVGEGAKNRTGPYLNEIIGRAAGSVEGYRYSKSLLAAGAAGLVWDEALIAEFTEDPKAFLKTFLDDDGARSKMTLKVRDAEDRADVAAYVAGFSTPVEVESTEDTEETAETEETATE